MTWSNGKMWNFYIWSTVGCALVLVILFSVTLWRIKAGTNLPFSVKLAILLIISNVGGALEAWGNNGVNHTVSTNGERQGFFFYLAIQTTAEIMRDGCFSAAMWIFSFEYFIGAISIPYIFNQAIMPESVERRNKVLFWSVLVACIASPVLYASLLAYGNIGSYYNSPRGNWFTLAYLTIKYTIGGEQLISGIFAIVAILMIRKFLIANGMES